MGADISKHDVVKKKEKVFRTSETCANLDVVYSCSICDNSVMVYFIIHIFYWQGMLDLRIWPNREADGNAPTTTPGKGRDHGKEQMHRLAKLAKKHRNGHMTKVQNYLSHFPYVIC